MKKKLGCLNKLSSFFIQMAIEILIVCFYTLLKNEAVMVVSQDQRTMVPLIIILIGVRLYLLRRDCKTFRESNTPEVLAGFFTILLCFYYGLSDTNDLALYECALFIGYYLPRLKSKKTKISAMCDDIS